MRFIERYYVFFCLAMVGWMLIGCVCTEMLNPPPAEPTPTPIPAATSTPLPVATNTPSPQCPADCDDSNPCTLDYCDASTSYQCAHTELDGDQPGCSGEAGECQVNTCVSGTCLPQDVVPCCGNGVCETGEGCTSCSDDCGCLGGMLCCTDVCMYPECSEDADCGASGACMNYYCSEPGTCDAECVEEEKDCLPHDGCCPSQCDFLTDSDCPAYSLNQWINVSEGLSVQLSYFSRKTCYGIANTSIQGQEKEYLKVKFMVKVTGQAGGSLAPSEVTIQDDTANQVFTASSPVDTDCELVDSEYILTSSKSFTSSEAVPVVLYFPVGSIKISSTSKKIIVNKGEGQRYVFLATP